jgi:dihydroorotase
MAHQYYPGADRSEIFRVFQYAASRAAPIYTHVRSMGLDAMQEVIANAAATGAPLHIVHVNSSSLGDLPVALELIAGARKQGVDVTTESYPYTAGSTGIQSSIFDDGWQERLGIDYADVQWQDTGERLDEETFELLREEGGTVIIHMMKPEMIELAMQTPFVIIASDGMPYAPGAHPRSAGTFSRVLGRYVREQRALTLPDAIRRMTLLPAQRLEGIAPAMRKKGRIQLGADADVTVFDPDTIRDTATFEDDLSFSVGVRHVLVGGVFVVRDGESVEGAFPGKAVVGAAQIPQPGAG